MKKTCSFFIVLLMVGTLFAGPFGLDMGMDFFDMYLSGTQFLEAYAWPEYEELTLYDIYPPAEHSRFEVYEVVTKTDKGITFICGWGIDINSKSDGTELIAEYNKTREILTAKYGDPDATQSSSNSSVQPREGFMRDVANEEIFPEHVWNLRRPIDGIAIITLQMRAYDDTCGFIVLRYESEPTQSFFGSDAYWDNFEVHYWFDHYTHSDSEMLVSYTNGWFWESEMPELLSEASRWKNAFTKKMGVPSYEGTKIETLKGEPALLEALYNDDITIYYEWYKPYAKTGLMDFSLEVYADYDDSADLSFSVSKFLPETTLVVTNEDKIL